MSNAPSRSAGSFRRRLVLAAELALLLALGAWVGFKFIPRSTEPASSISVKVQLQGALDRAHLVRRDDGTMRYVLTTTAGTQLDLTPDEFARRLHAEQSQRSWLDVLLNTSSPAGFLWVAIGLLGQVLFTGRMLIQWLASEREKRSVIPTAFWWMSLGGSLLLVAYFLWRRDVVGVLGQSTGCFIYLRNLRLIYRSGK